MAYMFEGAKQFNKESVKNWDLSGKETDRMFKGREKGEETMKNYKKQGA